MWWYTPDKWTGELHSAQFQRWWYGEGTSSRGPGRWRTAVFKLVSSPKSWAVSPKLDVRRCKAFSMSATMAASSAKRRSRNSYSSIFVWVCNLLKLNSCGCTQDRYRQGLFLLCLSIMLKKMLNRVDARKQPCFTPLCCWITMLRNFEGAVKALHDYPQSLSAHCVKRFGQVHKRYIQSFVQLPAFLLGLSEDEPHVSGAPVLALNLHWVYGRWFSAIVGTNLLSTCARIFPAVESRVIPR